MKKFLITEEQAKAIKKVKSGYDYACVMHQCKIPDWKSILDCIDKVDLYYNEKENISGTETDPHVTVLYGIHGDIPMKDIEAQVEKFEPTEIKYKNISFFESEKYDVLKISVETTSNLKKSRKILMDNLKHTLTFPDYNPHLTIAYVKKGTVEKYTKNKKLVDLCKNIDMISDTVKISTPSKEKKIIHLK